MTFQFLCPEGHLLQGEDEHMGMQCQCPQCGVTFIIPTLEGAAPPAATPGVPDIELAPIEDDPIAAAGGTLPAPSAGLADLEVGDISHEIDEALGGILHIPCPNGHELEVPVDMVGSRAKCPHCGAEFRLRREKSTEYQREQEILDSRRAQFWFKLAIIAAGVVVVVLLVMIIATAIS